MGTGVEGAAGGKGRAAPPSQVTGLLFVTPLLFGGFFRRSLCFQSSLPNPESRIPSQLRHKYGCFLSVLQASKQTGRLSLAKSPFPSRTASAGLCGGHQCFPEHPKKPASVTQGSAARQTPWWPRGCALRWGK